MSTIEPPYKKKDIARSFSLAAKTYDQAAIVQEEVGQRLLERVSIYKQTPQTILDIGAGTGRLTKALQALYPNSTIVGLDIACGMVEFAHSKNKWHLWKRQPTYLCADMEALPFPSQTFDLVFSNLSLQWALSLQQCFVEFKRVLKPKGALFFTTLGPQTLYELKQSWALVDNKHHVNDFTDMHDIGDLLLNTDLNTPVVDMEMITVTYTKIQQLLHDLKHTGAHNVHRLRKQSLTSKGTIEKLIQAYAAFKNEDIYPATFEVIYGHALKKEISVYKSQNGVVTIPGDKIPMLTP